MTFFRQTAWRIGGYAGTVFDEKSLQKIIEKKIKKQPQNGPNTVPNYPETTPIIKKQPQNDPNTAPKRPRNDPKNIEIAKRIEIELQTESSKRESGKNEIKELGRWPG